MKSVKQIIKYLKDNANERDRAGMERFGITGNVLGGPPMPALRKWAKEIGRNHDLAQSLWKTGIYEARMLAILIEEKAKVTSAQRDAWAGDFDNWAICDGGCIHLFRYLPDAYGKINLWSKRPEEFTKRAAFALLATLAVYDKKAPDQQFEKYFPLIIKEAIDERNGVKKAVNWALRQIGKRNLALRRKAIGVANKILKINNATARWIAKDALRELNCVQ